MSKLCVLQPARHLPIIARLAEEAGATEQEYQERLRPDREQYDEALQRRVLELYVEHLCGLLRRVGEAGADLVLLPECTLPVGSCYLGGREHLHRACQHAEPLWLEQTAPIARQYDMLIASCYYRSQDGRLYNDGVLMDERGEIAGLYHKVHLPCSLEDEATEAGLFAAGDEHPVFETRIGKIGFQICYDIDFPEGCRCLALGGADVILHPTVGYAFPDEEEIVAEGRLRARATDNSVVVMYANFGPSVGRSAIYARNGNQIACCGRGADAFVIAEIDLRVKRMQDWGHACYDHQQKLMSKRRPDTYGVLTEEQPPALIGVPESHGRLYDYEEELGLP